MAAYLIAHAKIKDQAKLQEYAAAAVPMGLLLVGVLLSTVRLQ